MQPGECLDQEVASFLLVNPAQKEHERLSPDLRKCRIELLDLEVAVSSGLHRPIRYDRADPPTSIKCFRGQFGFELGGEDHRGSFTQHAPLDKEPVQHFLEMLERIGVLEPRIEHPMGINDIWLPSTAGFPGCKPGILP